MRLAFRSLLQESKGLRHQVIPGSTGAWDTGVRQLLRKRLRRAVKMPRVHVKADHPAGKQSHTVRDGQRGDPGNLFQKRPQNTRNTVPVGSLFTDDLELAQTDRSRTLRHAIRVTHFMVVAPVSGNPLGPAIMRQKTHSRRQLITVRNHTAPNVRTHRLFRIE